MYPLRFVKATIILTNSTDKVFLKTNFPSPFPEHVDSNPLTVSFEVAYRNGAAYVKKHFPYIEVEIIPTNDTITR